MGPATPAEGHAGEMPAGTASESPPPSEPRRPVEREPGGFRITDRFLMLTGASLAILWRLWGPVQAMAVLPDRVSEVATNVRTLTAATTTIQGDLRALQRDVTVLAPLPHVVSELQAKVAALEARAATLEVLRAEDARR